MKAGFDQIEQSFRIAAAPKPAVTSRSEPRADARGSDQGGVPHPVTGAPTKAGKLLGRGVVHGGKQSAAQMKALGRIFRKL